MNMVSFLGQSLMFPGSEFISYSSIIFSIKLVKISSFVLPTVNSISTGFSIKYSYNFVFNNKIWVSS